MKTKKLHFSSGQIATTLLVLAVVILLAAVGIYFFLKYIDGQKVKKEQEVKNNTVQEPPKPVYETRVGDVNFTFISSRNRGSVMKTTEKTNFVQQITTTDYFIEVKVGAQNKGKINLVQGSWNVGNIVDSEGRNFVAIDTKAYPWLPKPNLCASLLKPEFQPTPCVKIYEVSKASTGLKVEVLSGMNQGNSKKQGALLDLNILK